MSKEDFKKLCKTAWGQPHGFVVINLTSYKDDGKYRLGPDNFIFQIKPKHSINNKMDTTMLAKIVHNTEPKNAFYLLLSERSIQIATNFRQTLQLDGKWEMALVGLETYYSFPNIDMTKHNLRYS